MNEVGASLKKLNISRCFSLTTFSQVKLYFMFDPPFRMVCVDYNNDEIFMMFMFLGVISVFIRTKFSR